MTICFLLEEKLLYELFNVLDLLFEREGVRLGPLKSQGRAWKYTTRFKPFDVGMMASICIGVDSSIGDGKKGG